MSPLVYWAWNPFSPFVQRLYNWCFNNSRGSTSGTGRTKIIDLSSKKKKKPQPFQIYTQLYYETKWKTVLDEEYIQYKQNLPAGETLKRHFTYAMDRMRQIFANESDDVKQEVEEQRKKLEGEQNTAVENFGAKEILLQYQR